MDLDINLLFKKQLLFNVLLFGLGLLFFSCGPRKVHKTGIRFNTSAMTGSSSGGLILVGERTDTDGYFSTRIATPDPVTPTTVELPEGTWNFFAMTWDGTSGHFTGTPRCAKFVDYKIPEDLDRPVSFTLTKDKCYHSNAFNYAKEEDASGNAVEQYGDSSALEKIPKLRLITCSNLEGISGSTSTCDFPLSKLGSHNSYRISMGGTKYGLSTSILTTLESKCLSNTSLTNPIFETELRIGIKPDRPFGVNIHAYEDKNCSKYGTTYSFPKGLGHNTNLDSKTFPHSNSQSRNSIYIADNHLGYGTSTLSNISPSLNCQNTDGDWIHCLPGATTAYQNQSSFHSVKGELKNLFGTSDALDPYQVDSSGDSSQGRKEIGVLGEMAFLMTGPIGAAFFQTGFRSCQDDIPTSGSSTINLTNNESALVNFLSPQKTIPSHYTGGGSAFDKRIGLSLKGNLEFLMEFRCPQSDRSIPKVGWLRMNHKDENGTNESQVELWYDTTNTSSEQAELYIYNKHFDSHSSSINKSRSIIKFKKTGAGTFTAWLTGLGFQPGTSDNGGISPSSDDDFTTCSTPNCQTCHDQSGANSSGCPSISSGDSPSSSPILNGINNLSTSSLADGDADGWSALSPFSLTGTTQTSPGSSSSGFYNYSYRYLVKGVMGPGQTSKISINSIYPSSGSSSCSVPSNLNSDNTAAWLKADSLGLSNGAAVSSWGDSFSNSSDDTLTQTTTTKKPTYSSNGLNGKPALYFDGGDNLFGASYGNNIGESLNGQNGYTLFFVAHPEQISNSTSSRVMLLMGASGTPKIRAIINSSHKFSINTRPRDGTQKTSNNSNETITSASILIAKTNFSGDSIDFYGSISRSTPEIGFPESNYSWYYTSGYPNPNLNLTLGMQYGDNDNPRYFKGYIAEIILMKTALSTSDINNVKTYLECKYNLNTSN